MKALAINGSPRPGGNTETLLKKVLAPLEAAGWSTEYLRIGGKPVRGCMACMKCGEKRNGRCVIEGDAVNDCLEKMFAADAIILGSPTYFSDVTAEMKALIDRAAELTGKNRTDFVLTAARHAAEDALMDRTVFAVNATAYREFLARLVAMLKPNRGKVS